MMSTLFDQQQAPEQKAPAKANAAKPKPKKAAAPKAEPKKAAEKKPSTAVAVHQPRAPAASRPAKITNANSMLAFIGTASMDPRVDPTKMRELVAIRKELKQEEQRDQFDAAFYKLAMEIATIKITKRGVIQIFDKNDTQHLRPPIQSTPYAKYEDLNRIIRPILHKHGFTLKHALATSANAGKPIVKTRLVHKGGACDESEFEGEIDASGSKNNVQGRGSTISYGKRYNAVSLLDIITEDDDDANAGKNAPITEDQLRQVVEECEARGVDKRKFCEAFKVEGLAKIPASRFEAALATIRQKPIKKDAAK